LKGQVFNSKLDDSPRVAAEIRSNNMTMFRAYEIIIE
jgi:hypothetical protein